MLNPTSGATQAGWQIFPFSWKLNYADLYLWSYPGWLVDLPLLLEAELSVRHIDSRHELIVRHAVNLTGRNSSSGVC